MQPTKQDRMSNNQQQQTNAEQVGHQQQMSAVATGKVVTISCTSTLTGSSDQLVNEGCSSCDELDAVIGERLSVAGAFGRGQPLGSFSTVGSGAVQISEYNFPGWAPPAQLISEECTNESVEGFRRSLRFTLNTHEYKELE